MVFPYTHDGVRYDCTSHLGKDKIILCSWRDDELEEATLLTDTKGGFRRRLARTQDPVQVLSWIEEIERG